MASAALAASTRQAFAPTQPSAGEVERYLSTLHLEDLALAVACGAGLSEAWEHFVRDYRPALYRAAEAIDRTGGGRELADSLYGDLFGLREHDGERQSLFRYFHGRSSLATWVRAILAQRHVDRLRQSRRLVALPDDQPIQNGEGRDPDTDTESLRFRAAIGAAFAAAVTTLAARDRLRLVCYYVQNMKLAAIGRMFGEHEATASRHLARVRRELRGAIERHLRDVQGFDEAAVAECFRAVAGDSGELDLETMIGADAGGKISPHDRSEDRRARG
jgi:RNA polymerase sigma factor (sigma-70 family)